ncbi:hypothetical protein F1721_27595 [Saccharopolyspora hirsuta]|uniref:Uncharacterized protein n=1 Tax=Saccharopolyspora hirsuta TaxID=1837 RepID=A0A5M7BH58_SACHI|nr:hypothetical protein F1721_27595 [Saccharopolyspora hirsuta]
MNSALIGDRPWSSTLHEVSETTSMLSPPGRGSAHSARSVDSGARLRSSGLTLTSTAPSGSLGV